MSFIIYACMMNLSCIVTISICNVIVFVFPHVLLECMYPLWKTESELLCDYILYKYIDKYRMAPNFHSKNFHENS